jgi:ribosomal protein L7/L12
MNLKKIVTITTECGTGNTSEKVNWEWGIGNRFWVLSNAEATELCDMLSEALTVTTNTELSPVAITHAQRGTFDGKMSAIKEVRAVNGMSLGQAKDLVEKYMSDNNITIS